MLNLVAAFGEAKQDAGFADVWVRGAGTAIANHDELEQVVEGVGHLMA